MQPCARLAAAVLPIARAVAIGAATLFLATPLLSAQTSNAGIHKWPADPEAPRANRELALFATSGYEQDREGIGIYALPDGTGYVVCVDQLPHDSIFHVYRREGEPDRPHDHSRVLFSFKGGADAADGLDITSRPLGPDFPDGVVVAMNSDRRNFLMFRWRDIAAAATPPLRTSTLSPAAR